MIRIVVVVIVVALLGYFYYKSAVNKALAQENIRLGQAFLEKNALDPDVESTTTGLQYKVLTPGTGSDHPKANDKVTVHYHGTLIDGTVFDSSKERGKSISFSLNQVIPGWTEGLQLMVVGETTRLFIPSNLGYGNRETGAIKPGSLLIFDVELIAIN